MRGRTGRPFRELQSAPGDVRTNEPFKTGGAYGCPARSRMERVQRAGQRAKNARDVANQPSGCRKLQHAEASLVSETGTEDWCVARPYQHRRTPGAGRREAVHPVQVTSLGEGFGHQPKRQRQCCTPSPASRTSPCQRGVSPQPSGHSCRGDRFVFPVAYASPLDLFVLMCSIMNRPA